MTDVPHRITPSFASHIQFCRTEEFSLNPSFSCYLPLSPLFLRSEIRRAFHIIVSLAPFSLPFRHHWRSKMQPKSSSAKTTLPASVMLLPWLSAWHTSSWSDALETRNSAHQMILKFANLQMIMAAAGVDWIWSSDFVGITWIDVVSEGVHCWRWVLAKLCVWLESVSFCKNLTLLGTGRWKEGFWGLDILNHSPSAGSREGESIVGRVFGAAHADPHPDHALARRGHHAATNDRNTPEQVRDVRFTVTHIVVDIPRIARFK